MLQVFSRQPLGFEAGSLLEAKPRRNLPVPVVPWGPRGPLVKRHGMIDLRSAQALGIIAGISLLTGCGGSQQPMSGAPSTGVQPAARSPQNALKGYYLATFTTVVGSGPSSFCVRFTPSGSWSSTGSGGLSGTYLTLGKKLYASALWLPSPAVILSLQGSVNAKQGSGTFILSTESGNLNGGGTFAMTGKPNKSCS